MLSCNYEILTDYTNPTEAVYCYESDGCALGYLDEDIFRFTDQDGDITIFRIDQGWGIGNFIKDIFDYSEYDFYLNKNGGPVIPDRGQTYLEAAQEYAERVAKTHEDISKVSSDSVLSCSYYSISVEYSPEGTKTNREDGVIVEDAYVISETIIYVPGNSEARDWLMAGNSVYYHEAYNNSENNDSTVPENAWICWGFSIIEKRSDGWHYTMLGTSW